MYRPFSIKQNEVRILTKKCTVNSTGFTDIFMHNETRKRLKWTVLYKSLCLVTLGLPYYRKLTLHQINANR